MTTTGIVTDGAQHVAYLLNAGASFGTTGELHIADKDGKDAKVATGIGVGSYSFSADGKGLLFLQPNQGGNDASLAVGRRRRTRRRRPRW